MTEKPKRKRGRPKKGSKLGKAGRKTKMTPEVLAKLEEGFMYGFTDVECCFYVSINETTLYRYCEKNPEFARRKEQLKRNPILVAKKTVAENLKADPKLAFNYLKSKCSEEFSERKEITGANGTPVAVQKVFVTKEEEQEALKHIEDVINDK